MTVLRRPPRQVYRLYTEEEFLAAADWSGESATEEWAPAAPAAPEPSPWGRVAAVAARGPDPSAWGRVAGIAALTGAVAVVAGVVVMSASRSTVGRRSALGLSASNRSPSSAAAVPPAFSRPLGRARRRHGRAPRAPAAPRRTGRRGGVREVTQTEAPVVVATADVPSRTDVSFRADVPFRADVSSPADVSVHATDTASSSGPMDAARSEFGFER